jgi:hypothetical protein
MKLTINNIVLSLTKINKNHVQFALMVVSLVMLVLGAGAPEEVGGVGR